MARRMFPDGDRAVYALAGQPTGDPTVAGFVSRPSGSVVTVTTDDAGLVPADVRHEDGSTVTMGSPLVVDALSRLPLFQGPNDNSDTLYVSVTGGTPQVVHARSDDRLDSAETRLTTAESGITTLQAAVTAIGTPVPSTRTIGTAGGSGLTGGGALSSNLSLAIAFGSALGTAAQGNDPRLSPTVEIQVIDDATTLTTGDGKERFWVPPKLNNLNLTQVIACVSTVSSSGLPTVQIANVTDGFDMLSTKVSIDANEKTSLTAATAAVIDTAHDDVQTGDELRIDVDVAGTGAKGLAIILVFG